MKLTLVLLSLAAYGQATINAPAVTLDATGSTAVRDWMLTQTKGAETKLAADAAIDATSMTVDSGTGISASSVLIIGAEMVTVTAKTGAVLTVTRGSLGTTPAAYTAGTEVKEAKYRSYNALGKQIIVDALKQIVGRAAALNAPVESATTARDAAVTVAVQ